MNEQTTMQWLRQALDEGNGVVRLVPNWVPRVFCVPGRRLRLHPADLYALGAHRGGIDERWFASTIRAENGPHTAPDEGLSFIWFSGQKITLAEAIGLMGDELLGRTAIEAHGGWVMYAKFFDNMYPLPHHIHQSDEAVASMGLRGKPEAYFYPAQYNPVNNTFPYTFFGLEPGTTKDQVIACLKRWNDGDNGILRLSKAYRLTPGEGWDVPTGILHAPGTLCTYEPQRASDVFSMWQSLTGDYQPVERSLLTAFVPPEYHEDYDYLLSLLDWEANVDPYFRQNHYTAPHPTAEPEAVAEAGFGERWVVFGSPYFSAKELTVAPGRSVVVRDAAAYGCIVLQGYGMFADHPASAPSMIRFGEMTEDEFFVSVEAAQNGVVVTNLSTTEPLVIVKHFNPGNPDMPQRMQAR
jgi:hypothetical protein